MANMPSEKGHIHTQSLLYIVAQHPFQVKPSGNALLEIQDGRKGKQRFTMHQCMGRFAVLPHDLILFILTFLSPQEWTQIEQTSTVMRSFAAHEPLWRDALIKLTGGHLLSWKGSWKSTLAFHLSPKRKICRQFIEKDWREKLVNQRSYPSTQIYSDTLYLPIQLASLPLSRYTPAANGKNTFKRIQRLANISKADFLDQYAKPSIPCLLTASTADADFPVWKIEDILHLYPNRRIRAEALSMSINTYSEYARTCEAWDRRRSNWIPDESPFYLFDPTLARQMQKDDLFVVPKLFRFEDKDNQDRNSQNGSMDPSWDLFSLLHDRRPDHAWIIAGPKRSGSAWHVDPNSTSAYNTVLSGCKLWMLLPPSVTPPGIFISSDGGTVTAPLSIAEWLTDFWQLCIKKHGSGSGGDNTLIVDVCGPGETIYIPAGWKHLVINLEESVAFTQNFVSPAELPKVLDFLKNRPDQISGFRLRKAQPTKDEEAEEVSDPELDELPQDGLLEKRKIFHLFINRLSSFDESLCKIGLDGMRQLEDSRRHMKANSQSIDHRGNRLADSWWQSLTASRSNLAKEVHPSASMFPIDEADLGEVPW